MGHESRARCERKKYKLCRLDRFPYAPVRELAYLPTKGGGDGQRRVSNANRPKKDGRMFFCGLTLPGETQKQKDDNGKKSPLKKGAVTKDGKERSNNYQRRKRIVIQNGFMM